MPHLESIACYPRSFQIVIKRFHHRCMAGKNVLVPFVGATGSGKSLSALQLVRGLYLYKYGKEPTPEYLIEHTCFRAKEFMTKINSDKLEIGEAWIWDESGVDIGHKDFMSVRNKILGWLTQTFRNLRQIVIFTVPSLSFMDATVRKLMHYYLEVVGIDKKKKMCIVKPLELQYNSKMDKLYYHNIQSPNQDGFIDEISFIAIPKVSKEIEDAYDLIKNKFTKELNQRIFDTLASIEQKESNSPLRKLTERQAQIYNLLKAGYNSTNDIAREIGCQACIISENYNYMRRKGIEIDKMLKENGALRVFSQVDARTNLNSQPPPVSSNNSIGVLLP